MGSRSRRKRIESKMREGARRPKRSAAFGATSFEGRRRSPTKPKGAALPRESPRKTSRKKKGAPSKTPRNVGTAKHKNGGNSAKAPALTVLDNSKKNEGKDTLLNGARVQFKTRTQRNLARSKEKKRGAGMRGPDGE